MSVCISTESAHICFVLTCAQSHLHLHTTIVIFYRHLLSLDPHFLGSLKRKVSRLLLFSWPHPKKSKQAVWNQRGRGSSLSICVNSNYCGFHWVAHMNVWLAMMREHILLSGTMSESARIQNEAIMCKKNFLNVVVHCEGTLWPWGYVSIKATVVLTMCYLVG